MKQPCGLYRTSRLIQAGTTQVEASRLVFLHDHEDADSPVVHLPKVNIHNRWQFEQQPLTITEDGATNLQRLLGEGLYRVREHFHPGPELVVAAESLVQLGYNREGEPIVFFPSAIAGKNGIEFPSQGTRIPDPVYRSLEALDLRGPHKPRTIH